MTSFILLETAYGYGLFERKESDEIGRHLESVRRTFQKIDKIGKLIKLYVFEPFANSDEALENILAISEGRASDKLCSFLDKNVEQDSDRVYVAERTLASSIQGRLSGLECVSDDIGQELIRNVRLHAPKMLAKTVGSTLEKAQLGLGHSYSREKIQFNVKRVDNMVMQAVCLLDQVAKDVNQFSMRLESWYGWNFPELQKVVTDKGEYARIVDAVGMRKNITQEKKDVLVGIVGEKAAASVLESAGVSIGTDMSDTDEANAKEFARKIISLTEYRKKLQLYLSDKMGDVAPNLKGVVGEVMGARLISHSGGLSNLAKCPSSTVQILGAEKALFRALKTGGKTPKHGLLFDSGFVQRTELGNRGKISRYVANKCSIASRIDFFSEKQTSLYGEAMRKQIEERLVQCSEGRSCPENNAETMREISRRLRGDETPGKKLKKEKKEKKKKKSSAKVSSR
ncbi:MAG: U3 snoRNP protein Nop56 [Amphiamblys sp. WSBS2006]|nr:MAG: U3 snoRNP protein Nop56 [Amphiamblys sp. WSBS2006]